MPTLGLRGRSPLFRAGTHSRQACVGGWHKHPYPPPFPLGKGALPPGRRALGADGYGP